MLKDAKLVAFGATTDGARAAEFHGDVLGLPVRPMTHTRSHSTSRGLQ